MHYRLRMGKKLAAVKLLAWLGSMKTKVCSRDKKSDPIAEVA